jgi:hypothetical protein
MRLLRGDDDRMALGRHYSSAGLAINDYALVGEVASKYS